MKLLLLAVALLFISCGKYGPMTSSGDRVGEQIALNSQLTSTDRANLTEVCNSLNSKVSLINTVLNSTLSFQVTLSDCVGNSTGPSNVDVVIQGSGNEFLFRRKSDNQPFLFPNVETTDSGVMREVCSSIQNQATTSNSITNGSNVTTFTTLGIGRTDCPTVAGETCVLIQSALVNGTTARVHTKEWIRFSNNPARKIGYFTHRKKVAQGFCTQNQAEIFQATLK